MTTHEIQARIFLVGCPRSGTTLLQSMLAAHPQITSFPESFFYNYLVPSRPWMRKLGLASRWAKPQFKQFLSDIDRKDLQISIPQIGILMSQYSHNFISLLDQLTLEQEKNIWIEKTPSHLSYIPYIEQLVKEAKFIHLMRNGEDVVASLYEVTNKYPERWRGSKTIDECINIWLTAIQQSQKYLEKDNHLLVRHEDLTATPQSTLEHLCSFMDIQFDEKMLNSYGLVSKSLVLSHEPWKALVKQPIQNVKNTKFLKLFTESQRNYILEKTSRVNLIDVL